MSANTQSAAVPAKGAARLGYAIAIAIDIAILYVAHNLLAWRVPFFTPAWTSVLWAIDLSVGVSIAANVVFLFYDPSWFKHLAQIVMGILSIVPTYVVYRVFPFTLIPANLITPFRVILILGMVGGAIGVVANVVALVRGNKS